MFMPMSQLPWILDAMFKGAIDTSMKVRLVNNLCLEDMYEVFKFPEGKAIAKEHREWFMGKQQTGRETLMKSFLDNTPISFKETDGSKYNSFQITDDLLYSIKRYCLEDYDYFQTVKYTENEEDGYDVVYKLQQRGTLFIRYKGPEDGAVITTSAPSTHEWVWQSGIFPYTKVSNLTTSEYEGILGDIYHMRISELLEEAKTDKRVCRQFIWLLLSNTNASEDAKHNIRVRY